MHKKNRFSIILFEDHDHDEELDDDGDARVERRRRVKRTPLQVKNK